MLPKVSIIIPVYNVEKYITKCLQSVFEQTERNIEIVVVDDCGSDSSMAIAKSLLSASDFRWIEVKHKQNRGLSAARNSGVEVATGEYIFFLDSDDALPAETIHVLLEKAEQTGANLVVGNLVFCYNGIYSGIKGVPQWPSNALEAYLKGRCPHEACNKMIDAKWYRNIGVKFVEGILHEDEPWTLSLILRAEKVEYVTTAAYYYTQRGGSIMHNAAHEERRIKGIIYLLQHVCREYHLVPEKLHSLYYNWFCMNMFRVLRVLALQNIPNKKELTKATLATIWNPGLDVLLKIENPYMFFIVVWRTIHPQAAYLLWRYIASPVLRLKGNVQRLFAHDGANARSKNA